MKRKILSYLFKIYAIPINCLLKKTNPKYQKKIKYNFLKQLYSENEYCTVSFFPKDLENLDIKGTNQDFSNIAIVIQGPVIDKDNFTINTIRMYQKYYKNVKIIISTWENTDAKIIEKLEEIKSIVILNKYPQFCGYLNINYQLASSIAGVKKAKELGVEYVIKTRSDQRYYNPCALSLLMSLYEKEKVILLGGVYNSFYSKCFHVSDFMAFGSLDDMLILYSCKENKRERAKILEEHMHSNDYEEYIKYSNRVEECCNESIPLKYNDAHILFECPEIMIAYNYFCQKNKTKSYKGIQEAYDIFLRDLAVIVDADSLGFYWLKYDFQVFRPSWFERSGKLDMGKWLSVIQNRM